MSAGAVSLRLVSCAKPRLWARSFSWRKPIGYILCPCQRPGGRRTMGTKNSARYISITTYPQIYTTFIHYPERKTRHHPYPKTP